MKLRLFYVPNNKAIVAKVKEKFDVQLEPEVRII